MNDLGKKIKADGSLESACEEFPLVREMLEDVEGRVAKNRENLETLQASAEEMETMFVGEIGRERFDELVSELDNDKIKKH